MPHRFDRAVLERDLRRRADPAAPRAPWRRSISIWFAPTTGCCSLFTPPFDRPALDPGYIKGYPPGIRENGGQYTHARHVGGRWRSPLLGDGDKAGELFAMLNPINHARTRADAERYKVEPYAVVADIYSTAATCRPRRLDLVHRLRGLDVTRGD